MSLQTKHFYEFGPFRIDTENRLLMREGGVIPLTPKAFETLLILVERSGQVVQKDELMNRLWPDTFVEEGNLTFNISVLRKALGESLQSHPYIETIPRRGYRFVAAVRQVNGEPADLVIEEHLRAQVVVEEEDERRERDRPAEAAEAPKSLPPVPSRRPLLRLRSWSLAALALAMVVGLGLTLPLWRRHTLRPAIHSVAVLPFVNASMDEDTEYLSDGITESLINTLSHLSQLRVIARTTSFRYKGRELDLQFVGRELGVQAVLTGKVAQRGDTLIIQADLINVVDGSQLWGERYARRFSDYFGVQGEIARQIYEKLRFRLTGQEEQRLARRPTENAEAHRLYLMGQYFWSKREQEGLKKAIEYLNLAVQKDPNYAAAYALMADCYIPLGSYGILPPSEFMPRAKAAAVKALQLDETLAEAHASLGYINMYEWHWPEAEQEYQRAVEFNPNYSVAHHGYAFLLAAKGRMEEAISEMRQALDLDPTSLMMSSAMGLVFHFARRYDEAVEQLKKTIEMDPHFAAGHSFLGQVYVEKQMYAEALDELRKAAEEFHTTPDLFPEFVLAQGLSGDRVDAQKSVAKWSELGKRQYVSPYSMALGYIGLGEHDQALDWLEKAYQEKNSSLVFLTARPTFDRLHSDRRFTDLLKRIGLTSEVG
jgi:TolB-like protein/DNA-binding winged helix-turn-helix (wHTH) protein/Tfp pilus assembly protein PilF